MIETRFSSPGRIEVLDRPSTVARVLFGLFRGAGWLGLILLVCGPMAAIVDSVAGRGPWTGLGIALQGGVLALLGRASAPAWRRLAIGRRTIIDRASGTIEMIETPASGPPRTTTEACAEVLAVRVVSSETSGPERILLRIHRIELALAHERTMMIGDVGEVGDARAGLERAAGHVARVLGVPLEQATVHEVPPAVERVLTPRPDIPVVERSHALMSWGQRLVYVPGIAVLLCGSMFVALGTFEPVHTLDCQRSSAGSTPTCTLTEATWRGPTTEPIEFALDGHFEDVSEEREGDGGSTYIATDLHIHPLGRADAIVIPWLDEHDLRTFTDAPEQLAFAADDDAKPILMAVCIPLMLLVPMIPMLALGGNLRVGVGPGGVRVARGGIGMASPAVEVAFDGEAIKLHVHRFSGRYRWLARLSCSAKRGNVVLIPQAPADVVERIADELATLVGPVSS